MTNRLGQDRLSRWRRRITARRSDLSAAVWSLIRTRLVTVPGGPVIEAGMAGDHGGRDDGGGTLRKFCAHSDRDRSYTYAFADAPPFPVRDYIATIRIRRVTEGDRAFVEWSAMIHQWRQRPLVAVFRRAGVRKMARRPARFHGDRAKRSEGHVKGRSAGLRPRRHGGHGERRVEPQRTRPGGR